MNQLQKNYRIYQLKRVLFTTAFIFITVACFAQVGIGTTTPNSSSVLDLTATDKGFLPPRMTTTQRDAIANPVAGMMIFNTTTDCIETYSGTSWTNLCTISHPLFTGTVVPFEPVAVTKTTSQRVFVHLMPWFESPATNNGNWGIHWTMANDHPNTIVNGYRQIASKYYPLTGPYASSDTAIIDYQLLLMKLSGVDGVLIDWPGTGTNNGTANDLPLNERNTKAFVARIAKAGLSFALVYEDNFLSNVSNKIAQAQADMAYAQTNYFSSSSYEKVNNAPLLLVFGPQQITTGANWNTVFSVLTTKPSFFTLWFQSNKATGAGAGEFAWINQDNTTSLNSFYNNNYNPGIKIASAYQGFNSYYGATQGGWNGPTWTIAANGTTNFQQTLTLALNAGNHYLQIPTWNDYGEGTIIEPTDSTTGFSAAQQGGTTAGFGFSLLTTLQQKLGVSSLAQPDLEAVLKLYKLRQTYAGDQTSMDKLTQVYYYMVSLQMDKAKALLATL